MRYLTNKESKIQGTTDTTKEVYNTNNLIEMNKLYRKMRGWKPFKYNK